MATTPAFLPGESRGQRSLAGYSPWGCKELDTTECVHAHTRARAHTHTHTHTHSEGNHSAPPWSLPPNLLQFSSVAQSCPTFWDPMNRSTPGLPVHHQLPGSTQTHVH